MAKNSKSVVETVKELAEPIAEEIGCWVWDVEFVKEGARKILRITIDSEDGVDINICEKMHRAIDVLLDEVDPISEPYYLEISSPGIERELRTQMHVDCCEGWDVEIKLYAPVDGVKTVKGVLMQSERDGEIRVDVGGKEMRFERSAIAKISTYFDFK